ncbi:hypothetical protein B0A48_14137 [Cryoendolithus antarcticus]|uniref:Cytokinesis regulator n=1 Tax=Cryoendolithus antarcticus TaxID=1507870 RepID=A0A1V8SLB5_9PEZI|nr:hypothetical protein B0A48_14137 [Cryoendolithus antarcticus]
MAAMAMDEEEDWSKDLDFDGDIGFGQSTGTANTALSSRLSVRSESVVGDDDWNVVLQPNDEASTSNAIHSAKQAGIPLPVNIPSSALLGGTIRRLGKQSSRPKLSDMDWDNDMDLGEAPLTLKPRAAAPLAAFADDDDFDDLEGSLGIRFAGTKRDARESSASAMSPSAGSATAEDSELDDMVGGLELPEGPLDFDAILKKRRAADADLSDMSNASPALEQPASMNMHKKSKLLADDGDDFLDGLDFGGIASINVQKRTANRNIKIKDAPPALKPQTSRTTLNFHDKPVDKPTHMRSHLPRPVSGSKPPTSRLEPVLESGGSAIPRERRSQLSSGNQFLKSKRSMPALRSQPQVPPPMPRPSFVPSSGPPLPSSHASAQRSMPYHIRRESDPRRGGAQSPPPMRAQSRLSNVFVPDTPSRLSRPSRADLAPAALAREAAAKRNLTKPNRRRNFGDGTELDQFDDLRTNTDKEKTFTKQPIARGPPKLGLRQTQSRPDMKDPIKRNVSIPNRMTTPAPPRTPASPTKGFYEPQTYTPSYLRDTAASRIARESKVGGTGNPRPRSEGPLMPLSTNWKAQIAARSPATSPSAVKKGAGGRRVQPQLIKGVGAHVAKTEKGMLYNPLTLRWEGNENTLQHFDLPPPPLETPTPLGNHPTSYMDVHSHRPSPSPPRPALIAPMSAATNLQVNGGMVFDPQLMKWLKLKPNHGDHNSTPRHASSGPGPMMSPSATEDEEDDPFAGFDELKDLPSSVSVNAGNLGLQSPVSTAASGVGDMHEEFDLGPQFIRVQRDEEAIWRKKVGPWFPDFGPRRDDGETWKWSIRAM